MKGIYIHIPFCVKKCNYCDFASYPQKMSLQDEYINALIKEMELCKGTEADTVYIGGGTPSVLSMENTRRLLEAINDIFSLAQDTEFTVEVNPKTIDSQKAQLYKKLGVNRISIGSQSFINDELKTLGRIHTAEDTVETYELLREAGFENISLDLMYALPGQTMESLGTSLERLLSLNPNHISCYGLKIEDGTPFGTMLQKGELTEADEDTFADMYDFIRKELCKGGYNHYEISNFAKKGYESRHNTKYWNCEEYLGIGPSAHSFMGDKRFFFERDINSFINRENAVYDCSGGDRDEYIMLRLRLSDGIIFEDYKNRFGEDFPAEIIKKADRFVKDGLLRLTETALSLTPDGFLISNYIISELIN